MWPKGFVPCKLIYKNKDPRQTVININEQNKYCFHAPFYLLENELQTTKMARQTLTSTSGLVVSIAYILTYGTKTK